MSRKIEPLPPGVVARITASATVTCLADVVVGLVKNSLDADASKIDVSIDYTRGNCVVEDDGFGIPPDEFAEDGGLVKCYYTSKYNQSQVFGRRGTFLASVAALSLLTVTSHHHLHPLHTTIVAYNSKIISRLLDAPAYQHIACKSHGTRVCVRNLFCSLPVRIKQRALALENGSFVKEMESLKKTLIGLLLSWNANVALTVRDDTGKSRISIRSNSRRADESSLTMFERDRVLTILSSSGLIDSSTYDSWLPVSATTSSLLVRGLICLEPAPTKNVQFISFGIFPIDAAFSKVMLYDEINKEFDTSIFGTTDDMNEESLRHNDRGCVRKLKRGRKGVDRWPMFVFCVETVEKSNEFVRDEPRGKLLQMIIELLKTVVRDFLHQNHLQPKKRRFTKVDSSLASKARSITTSSKSSKGSDMFRSWSRIKNSDRQASRDSCTNREPAHDNASLNGSNFDSSLANDICSENCPTSETSTSVRLLKSSLRHARVIGQVENKFILAVTKGEYSTGSCTKTQDVAVLIDQHAADERKLVEGLFQSLFKPPDCLAAQFKSRLGVSSLIDIVILDKPIHFQVTAREATLLVEKAKYLSTWGILYDITAETTLKVLTLPTVIAQRCIGCPKLVISLIRGSLYASSTRCLVLDSSRNWSSYLPSTPPQLIELINSRACRSAIMFNDKLSIVDCKRLVAALATCTFPFICAHGRPSCVILTRL